MSVIGFRLRVLSVNSTWREELGFRRGVGRGSSAKSGVLTVLKFMMVFLSVPVSELCADLWPGVEFAAIKLI